MLRGPDDDDRDALEGAVDVDNNIVDDGGSGANYPRWGYRELFLRKMGKVGYAL